MVQWSGDLGHREKMGGWQLVVWGKKKADKHCTACVRVHNWPESKVFTSRAIIRLHSTSALPVIKLKSGLMASNTISIILNHTKQGVGDFSSQPAISPHTICFLLLMSFMGWLWILNRRSTGAVGNSGIISPLNCNPMSVWMAFNIPKQFITFLSVFILFPTPRPGYQGHRVQLVRWLSLAAHRFAGHGHPFIRQRVIWPAKVAPGPKVTDSGDT